MSTLPVPAPSVPKIFALPSVAIARATAFLLAVIDVYAEAQRQVKEAERHYPFMAW
jgi:hypothetical protein